jgi:hypothetical protein
LRIYSVNRVTHRRSNRPFVFMKFVEHPFIFYFPVLYKKNKRGIDKGAGRENASSLLSRSCAWPLAGLGWRPGLPGVFYLHPQVRNRTISIDPAITVRGAHPAATNSVGRIFKSAIQEKYGIIFAHKKRHASLWHASSGQLNNFF